nr:hypothetical protein [Kofleriaceae bacterium]
MALSLSLSLSACGADLLNNAAIHAHVDDQLAHTAAPPPRPPRWQLDAGVAIPIYGSYAVDTAVYGSVRPSAYVFDWFLGAIAPAALLGASFATTRGTAGALRWTALGLYATTRVAIEVVGNLHVDEYDAYLDQRSKARVAAVSIAW